MNLVADNHRSAIEAHLQRCLSALLPADGLTPLSKCLSSYVLRRGKRLRPQLCLWVYQTATAQNPSDAVFDVACAWEIFHTFLLAHDDIIDQAETRRDGLSLHRQLQSLDHDSRKFGIDLAIVAGDLLFSGAMKLLAEAAIDPSPKVALLQLLARTACTTGFGQAVDIVQSQAPLASVREQALLDAYYCKTAAYTFEGPMLSGAILAGLDSSEHAHICAFARAVGQAYQMHNDLLDLSRPAREGCDLLEGKRTIPLMRARAALSGSGRIEFDQGLQRLSDPAVNRLFEAERLRQIILGTDAQGDTRTLVEQLLNSAGHAGNRIHHSDLRHGLTQLLDQLTHGYFTSAVD